MDTKALRQKILDLAIRGKLVPQDPNDEPASVLLERIREQKKQMVKEGKLKPKDIKNDSIIYVGEDNLHYEKFQDGTVKCIEDEIPFELPEGWSWARISSVCFKITDGTHHSPDSFSTGDYKYITAKNIKLNGVVLDEITYVTTEVHREIFSRCNPEFGDILYIKDGATSGIATLNTLHEEFSLLSSVALLKPANDIVNGYLCYAMQSPYFYYTTRGDMKGVGITRITLNMLASRLISVPPQNEQHRIFAKVKELTDLISSIENDQEGIIRMISCAKAKILDLAIRGQLVPQNPNDEPASVLLEHIRAEKEELIRQGKIKRDKKESIIFKGEDNSYYQDLPKNWCICTLGDVSEIVTGGTPNKSKKQFYNGSFPFFKPADLEQGVNTIIPTEYLSDEGKMISRVIPAQSTLICCIGTIGKSGFVRCECATNQQINAVIPYIDPKYTYYFCNSELFKSELMSNSSATTIAIVNKSKTAEVIFLLPPLDEQKRIVDAIETLFAQIDKIAEQIS